MQRTGDYTNIPSHNQADTKEETSKPGPKCHRQQARVSVTRESASRQKYKIGVSPTGEVMDKADLLEMLSRPAPFESAFYDQVQLYVYGQTAVVTSFFRGVGKDVEFEQRFMRVYANRDGRWQCVATQIVPVPEQEGTS